MWAPPWPPGAYGVKFSATIYRSASPSDPLTEEGPQIAFDPKSRAIRLEALRSTEFGAGHELFAQLAVLPKSLSEQSRGGGPQSEVAPTANDRGPFPVSVPKPLGAAIALGMAGWVTSVPASLGQFNQPIGGSSISPKIKSTQFTHEGSARQAGWAGLGSIVATRNRRRRHERQPNMRAV